MKRQLSNDDNRCSSSYKRYRPISSNFLSPHLTDRFRHRLSSNYDRQRSDMTPSDTYSSYKFDYHIHD
jgi:hypothetical protein